MPCSTIVVHTSFLPRSPACLLASGRRRCRHHLAIGPARSAGPLRHTRAEPEERPVTYNKEFGYSRKDVLLIGVGLTAVGYALYYGLQAAGLDDGMAGNVTQLVIFIGLCVGWVGSYVFRVANKKMTYVTQLEEYEEAVMKKRLDEMTEEEVSRMVKDVESQKKK